MEFRWDPHAAGRGWLDVAGVRLEAAWHGPPPDQAPTLVFLHEGLGSVSQWRDFPRLLASALGCGALTYSRQGYGRSDPAPGPWTLDFMHRQGLETLPCVLEACGVRRAALFAHSDGASIALIHASSRTAGLVEALVLEAPHVFVEALTVRSIAAAADAYAGGALRRRLEKHHGANTDAMFRGWSGVWLNPEFRTWNLQSLLPRVTVPVLVLQGRDDEYGTLAQVDAVEAACSGPVHRLVLENCGHSPHRDQPDQTLAAASAFLRAQLLRLAPGDLHLGP
jgi:pimeloyl-ACP methyl ester carboxylesterase